MSTFDVEFTEPHYDHRTDQYLIVGTLRLKFEGRNHRVLRQKMWLTRESRFNERWYNTALRTMREELVCRAKSEIAAALRYRPDPEPAEFKRITIPLVRRIYPQLIANDIVSVQPLTGPRALEIYGNWEYSVVNGNQQVRWRKKHPGPTGVDWKKEGF